MQSTGLEELDRSLQAGSEERWGPTLLASLRWGPLYRRDMLKWLDDKIRISGFDSYALKAFLQRNQDLFVTALLKNLSYRGSTQPESSEKVEAEIRYLAAKILIKINHYRNFQLSLYAQSPRLVFAAAVNLEDSSRMVREISAKLLDCFVFEIRSEIWFPQEAPGLLPKLVPLLTVEKKDVREKSAYLLRKIISKTWESWNERNVPPPIAALRQALIDRIPEMAQLLEDPETRKEGFGLCLSLAETADAAAPLAAELRKIFDQSEGLIYDLDESRVPQLYRLFAALDGIPEGRVFLADQIARAVRHLSLPEWSASATKILYGFLFSHIAEGVMASHAEEMAAALPKMEREHRKTVLRLLGYLIDHDMIGSPSPAFLDRVIHLVEEDRSNDETTLATRGLLVQLGDTGRVPSQEMGRLSRLVEQGLIPRPLLTTYTSSRVNNQTFLFPSSASSFSAENPDLCWGCMQMPDGTIGVWGIGDVIRESFAEVFLTGSFDHSPHRPAAVNWQGDLLIAVYPDGEGRGWDVARRYSETHEILPVQPTLFHFGGIPTSVTLSQAGRVAVGKRDGSVELIDLKAESEGRTTVLTMRVPGTAGPGVETPAAYANRMGLELPYEDPEQVTALEFSPDEKLLAAVNGFEVVLWRVDQPGIPFMILRYDAARRWIGHDGGITALAFSPDGKLLATAGRDKKIRLIQLLPDLGTEARIQLPAVVVLAQQKIATALAFSPDGEKLAAGWEDGGICFLNVPPQSGFRPGSMTRESPAMVIREGNPVFAPINHLTFRSDGILASSSRDGLILWDTERQATGLEELQPELLVERYAGSLAALPDERQERMRNWVSRRNVQVTEISLPDVITLYVRGDPRFFEEVQKFLKQPEGIRFELKHLPLSLGQRWEGTGIILNDKGLGDYAEENPRALPVHDLYFVEIWNLDPALLLSRIFPDLPSGSQFLGAELVTDSQGKARLILFSA